MNHHYTPNKKEKVAYERDSLTCYNSLMCSSTAVGFYILLRAVDRFAANYNSFPGQFDG